MDAAEVVQQIPHKLKVEIPLPYRMGDPEVYGDLPAGTPEGWAEIESIAKGVSYHASDATLRWLSDQSEDTQVRVLTAALALFWNTGENATWPECLETARIWETG